MKKIKILEEYIKNLDHELDIPIFTTSSIVYNNEENNIKLVLSGFIGICIVKKPLIKYDLVNKNFYSYIREKEEYKDLHVYQWFEKYEEEFKNKCKELFEEDNDMKEQKIIEVTNLDKLQKLLNDSRKLVCKLQSKIDKINEWQPEIKEKEKENKIDILNDYMKKINCHFFVEREKNIINLNYNVENEDFWYIGSYNLDDNNFVIYEGINGLKEYNMIMYHYKDFVDKVKELYKGE